MKRGTSEVRVRKNIHHKRACSLNATAQKNKKSPKKHVAPKIQIFLNGSTDRNGKELEGAAAEEEKQINVTLHVKGTPEFVANVIDKTRTSIKRI